MQLFGVVVKDLIPENGHGIAEQMHRQETDQAKTGQGHQHFLADGRTEEKSKPVREYLKYTTSSNAISAGTKTCTPVPFAPCHLPVNSMPGLLESPDP